METNDTTILDNTLVGATVNEKTTSESANVQEKVNASAENENSNWHQVVISGVSGIALGAAGVLFSGAKLPDEMIIGATATEGDETEEQIEDLQETAEAAVVEEEPSVEQEQVINEAAVAEESVVTFYPAPEASTYAIHIATRVNDDMSFSEAFATARREVGAQGAFVWHGQVYTTCYAEEWSAMTPSEQNAFSSDAIAAAQGVYANNVEDEGVEVHVLGVVENAEVGDGDVVNLGFAEIEGYNALFVDCDADGTFDLLGVDVNHDGYFDVENEVMEVNDPGMNVEAFNQVAPEQMPTSDPVDDVYAQMPDYTNDADVTSFV